MCGEYGERTLRPHYHALFFGVDFSFDRYLWRRSRAGFDLFRSPTLEKCWDFGSSEIGAVTNESASYVARYVMKKRTGKHADAHYTRVLDETGEIIKVEPEFTRMSLKPGIGSEWIKKFYGDVYHGDAVVLPGGAQVRPPRYYDQYWREHGGADDVEFNRFEKALLSQEDNSPERLAAQEKVAKARLAFKIRDLE